MPLAIKINPKDNVVVALHPIAKAQEVIIVIGEQRNRAAIEAHWKEV